MAPRSKDLSEQMRAESREQILEAARRLFARQGYFGTKVSDIAREAGMSQGNLYWYFSSKEDVLKAVLEEGFQTVETLVQNTEAHQGTGREKIAYLIDQTLALYQEQWEFLSITQRLLAHGGVTLFKELGFDTPQIGERLHHHLSAVFAQARDEDLIADIDPNIHAMFFFALVNGLVMTYGEDWLTLATPGWVRDAVLRLLGIDTTD